MFGFVGFRLNENAKIALRRNAREAARENHFGNALRRATH
jgi:hypothetical protein